MYPGKRFVILLLCVAISVSFTGCNEKTQETQSGKKPASSQKADSSSGNSSVQASSEQNTQNSENSQGFQIDDVDDVFDGNLSGGYHTDRYIPTAADTTGSADESKTEIKAESVKWDGPAGYVIVIPKGNENAAETAEIIKDYFYKNSSVSLKIVTDDTAAKEKEIVIGSTKRYKYSAKEGEYFAKLSGSKLIFGGGHDVTVKKAVQIYTRLSYKKNTAYEFSGSSDFTAKKLGYTYVWGDEFEGTSLDTKLWNRSTKMPATAEMAIDNTELTTRVENGYMKMLALKYWDPRKAGVEYVAPWSVTTLETMSYKYGYVEIRAKVPFVRGAWPSFWTSSFGSLGPKTTYDYSIEIDIFEVFSSLDTLAPNVHKWYDNGDHTMWADENEKYTFTSLDIKDEYHTYGFEWTPTEMSMYIDDVKYYTYDLTNNFDNGASGMGGFDTQLHLIFNNHLFTQSSSYKPYEGCEINSRDLPVEYAIDWVRLYQKNDGNSKLYLAN